MLSPSNWYLQSSMGFIYKEGSAHINPMTNLIAPFQVSLWLIVFLILFTPIPAILRTERLYRKWQHFSIRRRINRSPVLNMWALALGRPISNSNIRRGRLFGNFVRTLVMLWIILWFLIRSSYEGLLYNNMQSQRSNSSYDKVSKVINSNCRIVSAASTFGPIADMVDLKRYVLTESEVIICSPF